MTDFFIKTEARRLNWPGERTLELGLLAAMILVSLGIQVFFLIHFNINWDEFFFLSLVFEHSNGTLSKSLQTFHVHLFGWMSSLDWDEIRLTRLGRAFMLACELMTLCFIFLTARNFVASRFALLGVLGYLACGYVLMQGTSFRADPMITALLMSGIFLLSDRPAGIWKDLAATVAIALAVLVSIKSVFYAPALLGALVWRTRHSGEMKHRIKVCVGVGLSVTITTLILYFLHRSTLAPGGTNPASSLDSILSKVLLDSPFWPQRQYFLSWITASWPQMLLLLAGFCFLWRRHDRESMTRLVVCVLFALPILSIFFYRNAYPYFFPFIVAPAMIGVSIGARAITENVSKSFGRTLLAALVAYMMVYTLAQGYLYSYHHQTAQQETIDAIHGMFPEPAPYIDRNSMIATFPKCGFFMSSWGMEVYRKKGKPVFEQIMDECEPRFLIANAYQLEGAMRGDSSEENPYALLDQDARVLRSNFVHHWGDIWIAGKSFDLDGRPIRFHVPVEGTYTVESSAPVELDDRQYEDGDYLFLSKGMHRIASSSQRVELRYGRHLPRPDHAPASPIYFGFLWNILNMIE